MPSYFTGILEFLLDDAIKEIALNTNPSTQVNASYAIIYNKIGIQFYFIFYFLSEGPIH